MPKTRTRITVATLRRSSKRVLLTVALLATLAVSVVADCGDRFTFHYRTIIYGGRQYDTFVSCGSSAGNFACTCAEDGQCYENTSVDANYECGCTDGPAMEESAR